MGNMDSVNWREAFRSRVLRPWTSDEKFRMIPVTGYPEIISTGWYGWKGVFWFFWMEKEKTHLGKIEPDGTCREVGCWNGLARYFFRSGELSLTGGVKIVLNNPPELSPEDSPDIYHWCEEVQVGPHVFYGTGEHFSYRHVSWNSRIDVFRSYWGEAVTGKDGVPYILVTEKHTGRMYAASPTD